MGAPPAAAPVASASAAAKRALALAAVFVLPSGAAALVNQVVWVRLLGLSFGAASASVATVVGAFFLGLAVGSALAPRWLARTRDPLRLYLALEAAIGVFALLLLPVLLHLDALVAAFPLASELGALRFAAAFALLAPPTVCMGATYPVVVAWAVRSDEAVGPGLALVYAANTAGAVLGAWGAGFVLVPRFGLDGAVVVAAGLNFAIVALGLAARRAFALRDDAARDAGVRASVASEEVAGALDARAPLDGAAPGAPPAAEDAAHAAAARRRRAAALVVLAGTGFGTVANEVAWTHVLSILTGATIYGFAAILSGVLVGIAAGSYAMRAASARVREPVRALARGLVALALALVATRAALAWLPPLFRAAFAEGDAGVGRPALRYALAAALVLPPTLLYGALFPLSLQLYCRTRDEVRAGLGRAYAVNTVAGIAGSLFAAFVAIPFLGSDRLLSAIALGTLALPLALPGARARLRSPRALAAAGAVALAVVLAPHLDWTRLIDSVRYDEDARAGRTPTYLFLEEGHSGVVSVVTFDGHHAKLMNDGLNESFVCLEDADHEIATETLLGIVPWMLHAAPRDAFAIGLGGGVTARALARTDLERIRVVELEPEVVNALGALGEAGARVRLDARIELVVDDARHALLVDDSRYDLVVSQPSHPWKSGASSLFTHEFFELVQSRLRPGGVFGQWINLFGMDADTLASLLATFFDVFDHGFALIVSESGDLLVFGSDRPLALAGDTPRARLARPAVARVLERHDVRDPLDILRWLALSRDEALRASGGAPFVTDRNVLPEVRLASVRGWAAGDANPERFVAMHRGFDVGELLGGTPDADALDALARRMLDAGEPAAARRLAARLAALAPQRAARLARAIDVAYPPTPRSELR
ncbi:MAG: fused MFS/spermidine synthase [Myxococcota bacterium]